jgi:hypothetical protein
MAMEVIYIGTSTLTKLSILFFYRRITSSVLSRSLMIAIWASIIFGKGPPPFVNVPDSFSCHRSSDANIVVAKLLYTDPHASLLSSSPARRSRHIGFALRRGGCAPISTSASTKSRTWLPSSRSVPLRTFWPACCPCSWYGSFGCL